MIYILADNGASAEGIHGTIDELLAENALASSATLQNLGLIWDLRGELVGVRPVGNLFLGGSFGDLS